MKLEANGLKKTFHLPAGVLGGSARTVRALEGASFSLDEGKSLGVVGESGSGKTTLAKILAGFLTTDGGDARWNGSSLLALRGRERARAVQMVFQDPFTSLNPKLLLGSQIRESLLIHGDGDWRDRAEALLRDVGLSADYLARYPHQLSGGQRQRFAIARALSASPKILIADEPVSSLDLSVQAQILNLLNALRQKKQLTQLIIAHDLAVIANTCENVLVMKDGCIVESGSVSDILRNPTHPYTQQLLLAVPQL